MEASFRFGSSEEYRVWTYQGGVVLEKYGYPEGINPVGDTEHPVPEMVSKALFGFSKSQARTIASTMMQAAAEL